MSSRALRKLQRQKNGDLPTQDSSEEEGSFTPPTNKPKFNAFALLNDDNDDDSDDSEVTIRKDAQEISQAKREPPSDSRIKKSKGRQTPTTDDDFDKIVEEARKKNEELYKKQKNDEPNEEEDDEGFDFEEEYDMQPTPVEEFDSNFKYFTSKRLKQSLSELSIKSPNKLDPDNEYRNLFGNLSLEALDDANSTSSLAITPEVLQQFKRLARLTRGWSGKDRRGVPGTTRKLMMTKIKDDWLPTAQKPLNMEEITASNLLRYFDYKEDEVSPEELELKLKSERKLGVKYYRFSKVISQQEMAANTRFYASVVLTPDPDSLIKSLQMFPYHVETLLQVAMILLRQGNEKSTSSSLVERALFVFDRSFAKSMHELISEGKSELIRLPYESFMNRQFYLCLFRHITALGERRLFSTALAYCKLLLSFSPAEDPMGVRFFIDFYAIMSENYKYMVKLAKSPLTTTYKRWCTPGIAFSTVLAHLYLNDKESAKKALETAFSAHPFTAMKLYESIGLGSASVGELKPTTEDEIVCETYMIRAAAMWTEQAHRQFLCDELGKLFQQTSKQGSSSFASSLMGIFRSKKENVDIPLNLIRFAVVSGENKILAKLPETVWSMSNMFEYDVLPPRDTKVAYNEFIGVSEDQDSVIDAMINYVDHNLLGNLVQQAAADEVHFPEEG